MSARVGILSLLVMVCCAGFLVRAQPAAQDLAPHFTISGTSTVRGWSCPGQGVTKVTPGKASPPVPGFPSGVQTIAITVQVKAIACEDKLMIDHLREALKETAHPEIVYQLVQYTLAGTGMARATGNLTINGVTKPISFDVRLSPSSRGLLGAGETSIDMTEFGVTPPVIFEGLLKVGKEVRIKFDAVLPAAQ
jgi:hypothetical protein